VHLVGFTREINLFACELFVIVNIYRYCNCYTNTDIYFKINPAVFVCLLLTQKKTCFMYKRMLRIKIVLATYIM
jgi:hypothetical protein